MLMTGPEAVTSSYIMSATFDLLKAISASGAVYIDVTSHRINTRQASGFLFY